MRPNLRAELAVDASDVGQVESVQVKLYLYDTRIDNEPVTQLIEKLADTGVAAEALIYPAVPDDERIWVPQAEGLDVRPLLLHTGQGYRCNLLRVRRTGSVSRHRHPMPVTGYVISGRWHYVEHEWVAQPGALLFEPPGETYTLVVPEGETEMITLFTVRGAMIDVDPWGATTGYEDVFSKIELCRGHYEAVGLGAGYLDQFIR